MSEESDRQPDAETPTDPQARAEGASEPRRALPAKTGRSAPRWFGDWVERTLDVVDMMADATRETLLKKKV